MKYCLPYIKNFKYMEELDEVIIPYEAGEDVAFLNTLLGKDKVINKRVIIQVDSASAFIGEKSINFFAGMKKDHPEIDFCLKFAKYRKDMVEIYDELKKLEIPFFFDTYARDWDMFTFLCDLGVSDIYVVETLAFELDKIGAQATAKGISIRVFANVCQSSAPEKDVVKSFFIRPEDVSIYEPYVDVIEFYGNDNIQEVSYKVYAKDGKWFGPLKEILIGFEHDMDSRFVMPVYARTRIKCGKRCLKGYNCSLCNRIVDVADQLEDKGFYIKA